MKITSSFWARPTRREWFLMVWVAFCFTSAGVLGTLQGCDTIGGGRAPETTNEAILEAKATAKAYTLSIQSLATRCVEGLPPNCRKYAISRAVALEQLEMLSGIERDLRATAAVVESSGDPLAGGDILTRIDSTLSLVLTFLAAQE